MASQNRSGQAAVAGGGLDPLKRAKLLDLQQFSGVLNRVLIASGRDTDLTL